MDHIIPDLPRITAHWDPKKSDPLPELIVPCSDGETRIFIEKIEQPHPAVKRCIDLIKVMNDCTHGGYKPRHTKK